MLLGDVNARSRPPIGRRGAAGEAGTLNDEREAGEALRTMAKTMVANIAGARLRDTERELAMLRGEQAVTAFIESHPNETKVLQQMVEMRRAGKPAPSLARVQRAMLWSDGSLEFNTAPAPEGSRGRGGPP